jgi:hypothetical protein
MALSFNQFIGDGSTKIFTLTFAYLDKSHISVKVNGVTTAFTWPSASQVELAVAPAAAAIVEVRRTTPRDVRQITWVDGSGLTELDMNTSDLQTFFIAQETLDISDTTIKLAADNTFDANSKRIKNLADGVNPTDAATKQQVDNIPSAAAASAAAALVSQNAAAASAAAALVSQNATAADALAADADAAAAAASAITAANAAASAGAAYGEIGRAHV